MMIKIGDALNNIDTMYKQGIINYRGKTTDTKEIYTELVAEALLNQLALFNQIKTIPRSSDYRVPGHNGSTSNPQSNRVEERVILNMFGKSYNYIGKVVDYQVPIKGVSNDKAGKIDLLSQQGDTLIILELKKEHSQETLLRCVLEAATYWRQIDKQKLLGEYQDFNVKNVKPAVLVYKDKVQHNEYKNQNSNTRKLMDQLQVGMYVIESFNDLQVSQIGLP
jgi:hypothetical protein